jgi:inorganic pyrophosphatase
MSFDELRELLITLYGMVNYVVETHKSETAKIKFSKDIRFYLYQQLMKSENYQKLKDSKKTELDGQRLYITAYNILKNTYYLHNSKIIYVFEEDPIKRKFKTTKTKWNEFYGSLFFEGKLNYYKIYQLLLQLQKNKL